MVSARRRSGVVRQLRAFGKPGAFGRPRASRSLPLFGPPLAAVVIFAALCSCIPSAEEQQAAYVHVDFSLTEQTLPQLIADLPPEVQQRVMRLPQRFVELLHGAVTELPAEDIRLVDKSRGIDADYVPHDLVALDRYRDVLTLTKEGMMISQRMIPDLLAMSAEAERQGIIIPVSSVYRSYEYQDFLYNRSVVAYGQEQTDLSVARAGHSQHQLGTTIDFGDISDGFAQTAEGRWLLEHGWRFGFSLSYPKGDTDKTGYRYESWHYRYIGRAAARLERRFFDGKQQQLLEYLDRNRDLIAELLIPIEYGYR